MVILLSNDDGIYSDGIIALEKNLQGMGEIYTVAPDREQNSMSHALTLHRPLRVHEAGRDQPLLFEVAPHGPRHDDEDDRRDEPQHEHMLGDRKIDAEHLRQMDQRMVDARVRHMLDDDLAGVELLGVRLGREVLLDQGRH